MPTSEQTVTVLFPFDTGKTFFFDARRLLQSEAAAWQELLRSEGWRRPRFPRQIKSNPSPIGFVAELRLSRREKHLLRQAMRHTTWFTPGSVRATAVVFTIGVAFLVVEAELVPNADYSASAMMTWRQPVTEMLHPIARSVASRYKTAMQRHRLTSFEAVARPSHPQRKAILDSYFLFFTAQVWNPNAVFDSVRIHVQWCTAYVQSRDLPLKQRIIAAFLVANAAWYSLEVIDRQINLLTHRFLVAVAVEDRYPLRDPAAVKIAFMEAIDAFRPIRWTESEKYLNLMSTIRAVWKTDDVWKNVDKRLDLLSATIESIEERERAEQHDRMTFFMYLISGVSVAALASMFADVIGLFYSDATRSWTAWTLLLTLAAVGISFVVLIVAWLASSTRFGRSR